MIELYYAVSFIRQYKKLNPSLKSEIKEKIQQFKNKKNHTALKVHKLSGRLDGKYSFSVNYKIRIIYKYGEDQNEAFFLDVGDHSIY